MKRQHRRSETALRLLAATMLVCALSVFASGQDDLFPPDNKDIDEIAQMLDRVEYYATECSRYSCPKLDCFTARKSYEGLFQIRYNSQLLAFWISKTPGFERSTSAQKRYEKVRSLFRRLDRLIGDSANSRNFSNCLVKLGPACGDLIVAPKLPDRYDDFVLPYAKVTFPDGGEPSEGTAEHPDFWAAGVAVYWDAVNRSRVFLSLFPFPEPEESRIETDKRIYGAKQEAAIQYYVSRCCTTRLKLFVTRAGAGPTSRGAREDNPETWKKEISRFETFNIRVPARSGEYELRLYDPEARKVIAFAPFSVR